MQAALIEEAALVACYLGFTVIAAIAFYMAPNVVTALSLACCVGLTVNAAAVACRRARKTRQEPS